MAPVKFGLFKTRSREHQEQPSTENLLQNSTSSEQVTPGSPIPSTSKGTIEDLHSPDISVLQLDSDDEDFGSEKPTPTRQVSHSSAIEDPLMNYHHLTNQSSLDYQHDDTFPLDNDDASTSCDANSIQFDESSIAPSEDLSIYCLKKNKKVSRSHKEIQQLRDLGMWRASDVEVMQEPRACGERSTVHLMGQRTTFTALTPSGHTLIPTGQSITTDKKEPRARGERSTVHLMGQRTTFTALTPSGHTLIPTGQSITTDKKEPRACGERSTVHLMGQRTTFTALTPSGHTLIPTGQSITTDKKNLLSRSGNLDDQFKWEAIATARGLCTLTDNCTCTDCARVHARMADGDGGLGAAPLFGAISVGCVLQ